MELYKRDSWMNPNYTNLFNKEILEYDIQKAGVNLAIRYNLLPKTVTDYLLEIPKQDRVVEFGIMLRDNKELRSKVNEAFVEIRRLFFESNGLEMNDIVSIKKDAVFTTRRCLFTEFDNVKFQVKNSYTSYIRIGQLEFYYSPLVLDIKGINPTELKYHEFGMVDCIKKFIRLKETAGIDDAVRYVRNLVDQYKSLQLDSVYYREFRPGGRFRLKVPDDVDYPVFPKERLEELDITYNYLTILTNLALMAI